MFNGINGEELTEEKNNLIILLAAGIRWIGGMFDREGGFRASRGEAEAGVRLAAAGGALVEDGAVDLGNDDIVAAAAVAGSGA